MISGEEGATTIVCSALPLKSHAGSRDAPARKSLAASPHSHRPLLSPPGHGCAPASASAGRPAGGTAGLPAPAPRSPPSHTCQAETRRHFLPPLRRLRACPARRPPPGVQTSPAAPTHAAPHWGRPGPRAAPSAGSARRQWPTTQFLSARAGQEVVGCEERALPPSPPTPTPHSSTTSIVGGQECPPPTPHSVLVIGIGSSGLAPSTLRCYRETGASPPHPCPSLPFLPPSPPPLPTHLPRRPPAPSRPPSAWRRRRCSRTEWSRRLCGGRRGPAPPAVLLPGTCPVACACKGREIDWGRARALDALGGWARGALGAGPATTFWRWGGNSRQRKGMACGGR